VLEVGSTVDPWGDPEAQGCFCCFAIRHCIWIMVLQLLHDFELLMWLVLCTEGDVFLCAAWQLESCRPRGACLLMAVPFQMDSCQDTVSVAA
jgi:hypothetical protein